MIILGISGYIFTVPYSDNFKFSYFFSPIAGIFALLIGIGILYGTFGIPFITASYTTLGTLLIVGFATVCQRRKYIHINITQLLIILIFIAFIVFINNYTSIYFGSPGFLLMDGSDQLGYIHVANWIIDHNRFVLPNTISHIPYQSWPSKVFSGEYRFGSYYLLSIFSLLNGKHTLFTYDLACTVVFGAGCFAVSGVFSRSKVSLILLLIGLSTSFWFVYSRSGYFAKLLSYPGLILIIALFIQASISNNMRKLFTLFLVTFGVSVSYPGIVSAMLLFLTLGFYLFIELDKKNLHNKFFLLLILLILCVATNGVLSLPKPFDIFHGQPFNLPWWNILARVSEVGFLSPNQIHFSLILLTIASVSILFSLIVLSIYYKNKTAYSLLLTSLLIVLLFFVLEKKWATYEITGLIFPLSLCGGIILLDNLKSQSKFRYFLVFTLIILTFAIRISRIQKEIHRYSGHHIAPTQQFIKSQIDQIKKITSDKRLTIDVDDPVLGTAALVIFNRHNDNLQWTPIAWKAILAYRQWSAPKLKANDLILTLKSNNKYKHCKLLSKTQQFKLIMCKKHD